MTIKTLLPGLLGFGTAPLGNMFRAIPEEEAAATVEATWDQGIRYFDTAPFYGAGLSEIRLGGVLARHPRDEYVLSTKVGRVVLDETEDPAARDLGEKGGLFEHGRPNKISFSGGRSGHRLDPPSRTDVRDGDLGAVRALYKSCPSPLPARPTSRPRRWWRPLRSPSC